MYDLTAPVSPLSNEPVLPKAHARPIRLAYLVSHPIQYQAPLLRRIAQEPGIDLTVFFCSDLSVRSYTDQGFGVAVHWDVPLLEGYRHEFLPTLRDSGTIGSFTPINRGIFGRLRAGRFDALWLHGYSTFNAVHAMLAARALRIPVLLRVESTLLDRDRSRVKLLAKKQFFKLLPHFVAGILPIGTLNRSYLHYYLGSDLPSFTMPYAVDNAFFRQRTLDASASRCAFCRELMLDCSRPIILFASKLQPRKRCTDLIAAYLEVIRDPAFNPYLVIVGDGPDRPALQVLASASKDIRFCGFRNQSELPRFFAAASVFVLPSHHEPWGLIVNEAMAAGLPVIVSDEVGCQPDLVEDGVEGVVFPAGDISALTNALRRVLAPGVAERMGAAAVKRIESWSFEEDVHALEAALVSVTGLLWCER